MGIFDSLFGTDAPSDGAQSLPQTNPDFWLRLASAIANTPQVPPSTSPATAPVTNPALALFTAPGMSTPPSPDGQTAMPGSGDPDWSNVGSDPDRLRAIAGGVSLDDSAPSAALLGSGLAGQSILLQDGGGLSPDAGQPPGDYSSLPPAPENVDNWQNGVPDTVIANNPGPDGNGIPNTDHTAQYAALAKTIGDFLSGKSSPLKNLGPLFVKYGNLYDLDPRLMVAIADAESTYGENMPSGSFNPFGLMQNGALIKYPSWEAAINALGKSLTNPHHNYDLSNTENLYNGTYCTSGDCAGGASHINTVLNALGGDPNALHFPRF
jgi:hypothetical protein